MLCVQFLKITICALPFYGCLDLLNYNFLRNEFAIAMIPTSNIFTNENIALSCSFDIKSNVDFRKHPAASIASKRPVNETMMWLTRLTTKCMLRRHPLPTTMEFSSASNKHWPPARPRVQRQAREQPHRATNLSPTAKWVPPLITASLITPFIWTT